MLKLAIIAYLCLLSTSATVHPDANSGPSHTSSVRNPPSSICPDLFPHLRTPHDRPSARAHRPPAARHPSPDLTFVARVSAHARSESCTAALVHRDKVLLSASCDLARAPGAYVHLRNPALGKSKRIPIRAVYKHPAFTDPSSSASQYPSVDIAYAALRFPAPAWISPAKLTSDLHAPYPNSAVRFIGLHSSPLSTPFLTDLYVKRTGREPQGQSFRKLEEAHFSVHAYSEQCVSR